MVDRDHAEISIRRQCQLLGANRSGLYYEPLGESEENLQLMRLLDEQYTRTPFYGSRRMVEWLATQGFEVNRKRVARLMEVMGIEAVYPKPKLSLPGEGHKIYPYLLRGSGANARLWHDGRMPRFVPVEELFKGRHFGQEIVVLCVRWYLSFKLSYRDLVAMMGERGIDLAHTTILR